jgi:hypothetical protein
LAKKYIGSIRLKESIHGVGEKGEVIPYFDEYPDGYAIRNKRGQAYLIHKSEAEKYSSNDFELKIRLICDEIANTIIAKNHDYGDSFRKVYEEYGDISVAIRLTDKLERFKTLINKTNEVKDESKEDTLRDLAGYAILRLAQGE